MKKLFVSVLISAIALLPASVSFAASAAAIDRDADEAIATFQEEVNGADVFLGQAAGYLVFPRVIKVGIGIGAETGEGVLRVNGRSAAYFRTTSGSFGLQLGAQAKSMVIAFMTNESLAKFRESTGWQVGVDGMPDGSGDLPVATPIGRSLSSPFLGRTPAMGDRERNRGRFENRPAVHR